MRRLMPPPEFGAWLRGFLPNLPTVASGRGSRPGW